jgi:hypothetical protein
VLLHENLQFSEHFFDLGQVLALLLQFLLGHHSFAELELDGLVSELVVGVVDHVGVVSAISVVV